MNPLSVFTYYFRNKIKLAPVFAVLALAVFGISLTGVLTGSIIDASIEKVEVYREAAQVSPSGQKGHTTLDAVTKAELRRDPNIYALYPDIRLSTYLPTLAGQTSTHIYAVDDLVYPILMERFNLELIAGRLPRSGAAELALHDVVIKGRDLELGDVLDPKNDSQEFLAGKLEVVGILRGPTVISLASLDYIARRSEFRNYARSLLAFPQPQGQAALENSLRALDQQIVRVFTYSAEMERYSRDWASLDAIVWAINSVVVVVLSLLVGLLNMIYFLDRMNEFGLLLGIGYPRAFVIRRALVESLALTLVAWVFGLVISQLIYSMLNAAYFEPRGMLLSALNWRTIQFTLPIPIIVGIFAASTVIWQLRKFDPITIIERRD
ncbi:MAG: ABC transporter permease [Chloroflexi bacterium]|nr:ABC transporter permease [Chloroflexota bacterium]